MLYCRRIAYQETTQTFGVISSRIEIQDPATGKSYAQRPSASLTAAAITYSSGEDNHSSAVGGSREVHLGMIGDEIEINSLMIIDQHTFEGE